LVHAKAHGGQCMDPSKTNAEILHLQLGHGRLPSRNEFTRAGGSLHR
jgi:hypothetical protein